MEKEYRDALSSMEASLLDLSRRVPAPAAVPFGDDLAYRYQEQSIHQAIVQKLARITSTLHAARILLECGFLQEQGALQRMLDELNEDAMFLAFAVIQSDITELHRRYLDAFYAEEFDVPGKPLESTQKRAYPPRDKIRGYLANIPGMESEQSRQVAAGRSISKAYSGYIHGASPQIMEMYWGSPPRFHVAGMRGTPLFDAHREDLQNYFYRGLASFAMAAKAFGDAALFAKVNDHIDAFVKQAGIEDRV